MITSKERAELENIEHPTSNIQHRGDDCQGCVARQQQIEFLVNSRRLHHEVNEDKERLIGSLQGLKRSVEARADELQRENVELRARVKFLIEASKQNHADPLDLAQPFNGVVVPTHTTTTSLQHDAYPNGRWATAGGGK